MLKNVSVFLRQPLELEMASEFVLAFRAVVELAGDDPTDLARRANENPDLQQACDRLNAAATDLWINERYSTERFAPSVAPYEIGARREFERRWKRAVGETHFIMGPTLTGAASGERNESSAEETAIANALEDGVYLEARFNSMIEYMRNVADNPEVYDDLSETAADALRVWDDFRIRTKFRLGAALARLELVPFTLIPSQVSRYHGSGEQFSTLQRLEDAQRAFIFGCHLACAALQRSILEDVLHRNYLVKGKTLPQRINSAETALPWGLKPSDLHRIASLANDVLHVDRSQGLSGNELVRDLVAGLHSLQKLIEGAPASTE